MKSIKTKLTTLIVSLLFFGSTSVYAGAFDLVGDIELGLGFGFNSDYWNIGSTKIGPRAGAVSVFKKTQGNDIIEGNDSSIGLERTFKGGARTALDKIGPGLRMAANDPARSPLEMAQLRGLAPIIEGQVDAAVDAIAITGDFSGSGSATSVNGVNIDIQANYHIFSWLFFRSGATIDIALPVEFSLESKFTIKNAPSYTPGDTAIAAADVSFTDTVTYKVSGLDIEIPLLLGFNLIKTDSFSAYTAIGVNLSFGGYEETLSGSRSGSPDSLKASLPNGDFGTVSNKHNAFQVGLQWLGGIKYKLMDNVSIFTEVKWLRAAGIIDRTGTASQRKLDETGTPEENKAAKAADDKAASASPLGQGLNGAVSGRNNSVGFINAIEDREKGGASNNVTSSLNRSYVRWVIGATYTL